MATNRTNGAQPPVGNENINTEIITLTRFLNEEQAKHKEATGDFTYVDRNALSSGTLTEDTGCYVTHCNLLSRASLTTFDGRH